MIRPKCIFATLAIAFFTALPAFAQLQWNEEGVPLRTGRHILFDKWSVKSPTGDIFVVWSDSRDGYSKVYGQKFNSDGLSLWNEDKMLQDAPVWMMEVVPTSDNGLALVWAGREYYDPSLWAQKIDSDGNPLWAPGGVYIGQFLWEPGDAGSDSLDLDGSYSYFNAVPDASGGLIISWVLEVPSNQIDLYGKRLLADGSLAPGWEQNDSVIREDIMYQGNGYSKYTCEDGLSGLLFTWQEYTGGNIYNYAQRIDNACIPLWGDNGVLLSQYSLSYNIPVPLKDDQGGAFLVWEDFRSTNTDLYMQRVDSSGNPLWGTYGTPLVQAPSTQNDCKLKNDGFGGFLAAWEDCRASQYSTDLYCQRVDSQGQKLWNQSGVVICNAYNEQQNIEIDADGEGGLFAVWNDYRNYGYSHQECYIQHIFSPGVASWQANGIMLSGGDNNYVYSFSVANAGERDAIFTYFEYTADMDFYKLQKVDQNGHFQFPSGEMIQETIHGGATEYKIVKMNDDIFLDFWQDSRWVSQYGYRVYYQLFDINGDVIVEDNGAPICEAGDEDQKYPAATETSDGGAVITWQDYRASINSRLYAQKTDAEGNIIWNPDGVRVDLREASQMAQFACSDDNGGAYVMWRGYVSSAYELMVQRLDSNGHRLLGDYAIALTSGSQQEQIIDIFSDGEGGVLCVYVRDNDFFAIRVLSDGTTAWNDTLCYGFPASTYSAMAIKSVDGGGIVAWEDSRNGLGVDIYAQKFDNAGHMLWAENGIPVVALPDHQQNPRLVEDENGFTYFTFIVSDRDYDIYCQRLSPEGTPQFPPQGLPVCAFGQDQYSVAIVPDGSGGIIAGWMDMRNLMPFISCDIYAIHLNSQGRIANDIWTPNGNPVCAFVGEQVYPQMLPDGYDGAILAWQDSRSFSYDEDLYVQRINDYITAIEPPPFSASPADFKLFNPYPNPFNPSTAISYQLQAASFVNLAIYDITGREVQLAVSGWQLAGKHEVVWDASNQSSGIYFARLEAGGFMQTQKLLLIK